LIIDKEKFEQIEKLILKDINLIKLGFQHLEYMQDCNRGVFYRETEDKYDAINYGFGYNLHNLDPITVCKEDIASYVSFKSVEKILDAILPNSRTYGSFGDSLEFILYCEDTLANVMKPDINSPNELTHEKVFENGQMVLSNITEAVSNMNAYIQKHHLTFFDNFLTIQDLNDKILEKYDWTNWSKYFFKEPFFKAIIIMKLCNNNKKYDEFTKMYKTRIYNAIQNGRDDLLTYYENLIKVIEYLESGKYKEVAI